MLTFREAAKWHSFAYALSAFAFCFITLAVRAVTNSNSVQIIVVQGTVEVARAGQSVWDLASAKAPYSRLNPGDQIRTKDRSRATLRLSDLTIVELGPNAHVQLLRPEDRRQGFSLTRGLLHLFHRDKPGEYYFRTPTASPVIRGTEFNLDVAENGDTTLNLLAGDVLLTNNFGQLDMKSGDAALVQSNQAPRKIAALETVNVIQWCLYYPGVLHVDELPLSAEEQNALAESLTAYRSGELVAALDKYPTGREPASDTEKIYLAALLLAVGQVDDAQRLLNAVRGTEERSAKLIAALRTLIAAVKYQPAESATNDTSLASSLLAASYHQQSRFDLSAALASARAAVTRAPNFGFGRARVAELEASAGRIYAALDAVDRALKLSPRNAQAIATKGFLLAAQNHTAAAIMQFDEAIAVDGALGNAWLGRGLCRIRQGHTEEGVADLLVAAALEPNRAALRSYLGKAFDETRDFKRATSELGRAKELDPNDPTAWLYSALLNQQHNRVNDAIRDMERSRELNDNRQLYRSRLLLDQDLAVREANLAAIYQDAGLYDQSVREAARAVGSDYADPSAHLFLANSYAELGGANPANLRYETVSLSEYLVAELLSPVGGTALSPYVSQQEYTRMFQRDGFGISSGTEYRDNGDWRQRGVQYGTFGNFDYALDAYYASLNGQRPNNDLQQLTLSASTRFQLTPQDTVFFQVVSTEFKSGDLLQYWDQSKADPSVRYTESQEPNIFAGYHHEWSPGSHTLMLLGRLHDDFRIADPVTHIMTLINSNGIIVGQEFPGFSLFSQSQNSELVAYSAELQQIWKTPRNTMVIGGRYQDGRIETDADLAVVSGILTFPTGGQDTNTRLKRAVGYVYDYWEAIDDLWLVGGVSYDWLSYPENIDLPPITESQKEKDKVSPKAGIIWQPTANAAMRGSYTRSLGGVYFDNSVRLEPTQVAGFNQAYRTVMPESIAGILAGAEFQTGDVDFSYRLPTGTYLGVGAEWLQSDGARTIGVYESQLFSTTASASSTPQHLDYEEKSLTANINQLIGRDWSLGARYRVSDASLRRRLSDIPVGAVFEAYQKDDGVLHQLDLYAKYAHPSGFFAEAQGLWRSQESSHRNDTLLPDTSNLPGEDFWQMNVFVGYRFAHRRAELMVGGLNLFGQDYRLNPVNHYAELPRERTFLVSFKFNF